MTNWRRRGHRRGGVPLPRGEGIDGPLFPGRDMHALAGKAPHLTALQAISIDLAMAP